jgi:hypothetical protein
MVGFVHNELERNYPRLIWDTAPRGKTEENQETPQSGELVFEPGLVLQSSLIQVVVQYTRPRRSANATLYMNILDPPFAVLFVDRWLAIWQPLIQDVIMKMFS